MISDFDNSDLWNSQNNWGSKKLKLFLFSIVAIQQKQSSDKQPIIDVTLMLPKSRES